MKTFCYRIIPAYVNNRIVVTFFEIMRFFSRFFTHLLRRNYAVKIHENEEIFQKHVDKVNKDAGLIEIQNHFVDMSFGRTTMQKAGCEIIATYNCLKDLEMKGKTDRLICMHHLHKDGIRFPVLIHEFEMDGMAFSGRLGTAPLAVRDYFKRHGFQTKLSFREREFDAMGRDYDGLILTMYNDRNDIREQVHSVYISKDEDGYRAHNVYCNGAIVGPASSVTKLIAKINQGKAKGIVLVGIKAI